MSARAPSAQFPIASASRPAARSGMPESRPHSADALSRLEAQADRLEDLQAMLTGVLSMSRDEMCESKEAVLRERLLAKAIDLLEDIARATRAAVDDLATPPDR